MNFFVYLLTIASLCVGYFNATSWILYAIFCAGILAASAIITRYDVVGSFAGSIGAIFRMLRKSVVPGDKPGNLAQESGIMEDEKLNVMAAVEEADAKKVSVPEKTFNVVNRILLAVGSVCTNAAKSQGFTDDDVPGWTGPVNTLVRAVYPVLFKKKTE